MMILGKMLPSGLWTFPTARLPEGRQAIPRFASGTLLKQRRLHINKETHGGSGDITARVDCGVLVYNCRTYYKAVRVGRGGEPLRVEDMCYEIRRAEACAD
jgi:hypothetical protein